MTRRKQIFRADEGRPVAPKKRAPQTSDRIYDDYELQFLKRIEQYKRQNNRPWPTWCEILAIVLSLGYRQVEPPGPVPDWPLPGTVPASE